MDSGGRQLLRDTQNYWKQLQENPDKTKIVFSTFDDEIYRAFRADFPMYDIADLRKNPQTPEAFAAFCNKFRRRVVRWDSPAVLRVRSSGGYTDKNSSIVTRVVFFAIEIARNREGANNAIQSLSSSTDSNANLLP